MTGSAAQHWEGVYTTKRLDEVSWFEPRPEHSIELIMGTGVALDAAILDVGGGASRLAAELSEVGYSDLTVADISAAALKEARRELSGPDESIEWVTADVRDYDFGRRFDLWHDRAVFHFMVEPEDRAAYMRTLRRSLRPGGFVVIGTFGPQGPTQCSGLPVQRYGEPGLAAALGNEFEVTTTETDLHATPSGKHQQFLHLVARRRGE